jgi:hypothetical protein
MTVKKGDKVRVPPLLTHDPSDKKGEYGVVVSVDEDIVVLKFEDGTTGKYDSSVFERLSAKPNSFKQVYELALNGISASTYRKIRDLFDAGKSENEIAKELNIPLDVVKQEINDDKKKRNIGLQIKKYCGYISGMSKRTSDLAVNSRESLENIKQANELVYNAFTTLEKAQRKL